MKNKITVDRGVIHISYSQDPGAGNYPILVAHAGDVRDKKDKESEVILQIYQKTWMHKETLYELAQLINKHCPNNTIDWRATFFTVESTGDRVQKTIEHIVNENLKKYGLVKGL